MTALPPDIALVWLIFFVYCVAGWVIECTYCTIVDGYFTNRGFLNGPYLPIYGSGALMGLLLFGNVTDPLLIFLLGGTLCCALEWVTSWTMEKIYHARWWDYSHLPLNVQGRFWIGGFAEFGIGIDLVVLVVTPPLVQQLERVPHDTATALAVVTFACMATDLTVTHIGISRMRDKIDRLVAETMDLAEGLSAEAIGRAGAAAELAGTMAERGMAAANGAKTLATDLVGEQYAKVQERTPSLQALQELLSSPDKWLAALDWQMGEGLRLAEDKVRSMRPDLPQLPTLDSAAQHFRGALNNQERRMLTAFPKMRPSNYRQLARELSERFGR